MVSTPTYTSSTRVTSTCVVLGATTSITTTFTNTNNIAYDARVAIQLFGGRIAPAVAGDDAVRTIPANSSTSFTFEYTPQTLDAAWKEYDIGVGVFAANPEWDPNFYWEWAPLKITVSNDNKPYNFECGTQNWTFNPGGLISSIGSTTARAYSGRSSLAVNFSGTGPGTWSVWSDTNPKPVAGQMVQFRVYVPAESAISAVQVFVKEGASGNWRWTGNYKQISQLMVGAWNLISVTVPADAQPLDSLGVEFTTNAAWTGTAYVDSVEWFSSPTGSLPWLKTSGNQIVTAIDEQEVLLRGANVIHSEWQGDLNNDWEKRAVPELAEHWHGNVLTRGFASSPVNNGDEEYLRMLDEMVSLAEENRMYIILAWRSHAINEEHQPTMPDEEARQALMSLAARYRGKSHVMYALQVEPHDPIQQRRRRGDRDNVTWDELRPLFESMVDEIRREAAPYKPLVLIPGTDWSRDISGAVDDPVDRPNVVYKSHPYNPSHDFQRLFGTAHDAGLPVFVGEFALPNPDDPPSLNPMTMDDIKALLAFTRQRDIGWTAWLLDYETNPLMKHNLRPTTPYGATVQAEMLTTPPIPTALSKRGHYQPDQPRTTGY